MSSSIPTCIHYGVIVNINGFPNEIVLISSTVDQSSSLYTKAVATAQTIVSHLSSIATMSAPTTYLLPEQEASVIAFDNQIQQKSNELNLAIADTPTYNIPTVYRTTRESNMTDSEYLAYLRSTDKQRENDRKIEQISLKQERKKYKDAQHQARHEKNKLMQTEPSSSSALKKIVIVIYKIIFWIISLLVFLLFLGAITTEGAIGSTLIFLLTALLINPLIDDLIDKYLFHFPRWFILIILLIGLISGILLLPLVSPATVALQSYMAI